MITSKESSIFNGFRVSQLPILISKLKGANPKKAAFAIYSGRKIVHNAGKKGYSKYNDYGLAICSISL